MENLNEVLDPNETVEAVTIVTPEVIGGSANNAPVELNDADRNSGDLDSNVDEQRTSEDSEMFPRSYVEKLRKSEAGYREKAKRADELEKRLHAALVAKDGRLADPGDLEFNSEHLDDVDALAGAISELITRKPGLKAQQLRGDVGAGNRQSPKKPPMDLLSIIKGM